MAVESSEWAQLESIVATCAEAQLGSRRVVGDDLGGEVACVVAVTGKKVRGTAVVTVARAGAERIAALAGELVGRIADACRAHGLELAVGLPRVLVGAGLAATPSAGARGLALRFATDAGPAGVWFDLAVDAGAPLFDQPAILVIDDSDTLRQEVSTLLVGNGYRVVEACDGLDGMSKLAAHPEVVLVFCDLNMPKMDGLEFVAKVKASGAGASPPIVMLTSEAKAKLCGQAMRAGAVGWIVKPFNPVQLLATAKKMAAR